MDRRERHIKFLRNILPEIDHHDYVFPSQGLYLGLRIGFDDLTDEALERLADALRARFWSQKKSHRLSREAYAARELKTTVLLDEGAAS
jgi:hypothetical protein